MNKPNSRICIISYSDLKSDPRVRRQIYALKDRYDVTTLGLKKSEINGVREFVLSDDRTRYNRIWSRLIFLLARFYKGLYNEYIEVKYPIKDVIEILSDEKFEIIIANGLEALIIAERIAVRDGAGVLLDEHEYEARRIEDHWFHRLFINPYKDFLCRKYLSLVNSIITVSPGIADEFDKCYGVKPEVIMNVPKYQEIELKKVDPDNIRIIHHGLAHPSRNLEDMLYLMPLLEERFHLTLMLVVRDRRYYALLKGLAEKICPERVDFQEAVPFDNIVPTISEYDIQLIIYNPTSFNVRHSLPNKFFDSIMAGLALVIGPSPEMKNIAEEFNCGFVSDSFDPREIAGLLNSLTTEEIMDKKKASIKAAKYLNAECEMKKLLRMVEETVSKTKVRL
jgi:hypothetical protein